MESSSGRGQKDKLMRRKRRFQFERPSPFIWLILSAGLFLLGAASFNGRGARQLAEFGFVGAVMALAVIAAFLL
jgi:hypothetical protein